MEMLIQAILGLHRLAFPEARLVERSISGGLAPSRMAGHPAPHGKRYKSAFLDLITAARGACAVMAYYKYHVFFCTNLREDGAQCCAQCDAQGHRDYLKRRTKDLGIAGPGGVRVNTAGCMDRCAEGPVVVVYPEGTWYTYVDRSDLDEILQEHLVDGRVVERLRLPGG